MRIANDSDYGLSGTVWTADVDRGLDVARRVRTGTYTVNNFMMEFSAPFGGFKCSGIGRELGPEGLSAYLEPKTDQPADGLRAEDEVLREKISTRRRGDAETSRLTDPTGLRVSASPRLCVPSRGRVIGNELLRSSSAWNAPASCRRSREYIAIPNQSPAFDPQWREHGHMERAVELIADWVRAQQVAGLHARGRAARRAHAGGVDGGAGRRRDETVLLYGHLDKQPPMDGWSEGLGPWTPVVRDGKLYGRGGADDGYAAFACVAALQALQRAARAARALRGADRGLRGERQRAICRPTSRRSPIASARRAWSICLDSGCGNYEQLWITTSLRGLVGGTLTVGVLDEGVHSGGGQRHRAVERSASRASCSARLEDARHGRDPAAGRCTSRFPPSARAQAGGGRRCSGRRSRERFRSPARRGR